MNRLEAEQQRLYLSPDTGQPGRAMVLELARPASWEALAKVWQGVQADLELPAPGIAVNGVDGYQLWFSPAEAVPAAQGMAFLEGLRARYLREIRQERITTRLAVTVLPPVEVAPGRWSAFVTSDLAGLFEEESWLDLPPGLDAQADLLSRLQSMKARDLQRALERLGPVARPAVSQTPPSASPPGPDSRNPKQFLLQVMNDTSIELHLRIKAAKALLPYFEGEGRP
jgi:hypothetical protein